ncbi:MAG: phosphatidylinositol dimannoside acyltransferase [Chloroflexota bacterium]|nr:phosphatidylinositol dimannoside acyltransferase [Chloroflexota bacterium]
MTDREGRLEAPHRRGGASPRIVERSAVLGYRSASWLLRTLPAGPSGAVLGLGSQASYLLWQKKRAWSNQNFGHVLGLPPDDPRVRRLALRAYQTYGRYLVELMRVPHLPPEQIAELMEPIDPAQVQRIRDASLEGGVIVTAAHVGNNDLIGAAIAHLGLPLNVVADDSAFPELFDHLRRQREAWHATMIPWRNLRAIFGVLRRHELLGLLVDWGYRSDGIPVKLFDAWTTLPAGPATLAAKTASSIVPVITTRQPDGRLRVSLDEPIIVTSADPAELQRATQAIADAVERTIRPAPEQWYSFKPIWPASAAESADLERRGRLMQAGRPDPGPTRGLPRDEADRIVPAS